MDMQNSHELRQKQGFSLPAICIFLNSNVGLYQILAIITLKNL